MNQYVNFRFYVSNFDGYCYNLFKLKLDWGC
jgi:hypothetical protein